MPERYQPQEYTQTKPSAETVYAYMRDIVNTIGEPQPGIDHASAEWHAPDGTQIAVSGPLKEGRDVPTYTMRVVDPQGVAMWYQMHADAKKAIARYERDEQGDVLDQYGAAYRKNRDALRSVKTYEQLMGWLATNQGDMADSFLGGSRKYTVPPPILSAEGEAEFQALIHADAVRDALNMAIARGRFDIENVAASYGTYLFPGVVSYVAKEVTNDLDAGWRQGELVKLVREEVERRSEALRSIPALED